MHKYFGYIRVSTVKQGERGVSLQEQRDAILRYGQRSGIDIVQWFEERETAAKRGRPLFTQMLKLLRRGKADGVVIHKIDRGARNLKDWADLGELIDAGVEVHFANESLDLQSRGGRLSADIQAVVAADYIRNLREETRKGFYGRLKQGFYPLPAPLGYLDSGKAQLKQPDPVKAPLVRKAFELYASGAYSLDSLVEELYRLGLRNSSGAKVPRSSLSDLLNNPFYIGIIRVKKTGEVFVGGHQPLISKSLFDRVQNILEGKSNTTAQKYDFLFRRMLVCGHCGFSLTGERQKGHVYYRCHTKGCLGASVREEVVEKEVLATLERLQLSNEEIAHLDGRITEVSGAWKEQQESALKALRLRLDEVRQRLNRLTDAYIDRMIEKEVFESRKGTLLMEQKEIEENIEEFESGNDTLSKRLYEFFELLKTAYFLYKSGFASEKRELLKMVTSNLGVSGKEVAITLSFPFSEVAKRPKNACGGPYRDTLRTFEALFSRIVRQTDEGTGDLASHHQ